MINRITLSIPYPKKLGLISINTKRKVSFIFDNYSVFLFREKQNITTNEDFTKWRKEHSEFDLFLYGAYYAAENYTLQERKKFNIDIKKFATGIASLKEQQIKDLMNVWKRSQSFGSDEIKGKKKAEAKN